MNYNELKDLCIKGVPLDVRDILWLEFSNIRELV